MDIHKLRLACLQRILAQGDVANDDKKIRSHTNALVSVVLGEKIYKADVEAGTVKAPKAGVGDTTELRLGCLDLALARGQTLRSPVQLQQRINFYFSVAVGNKRPDVEKKSGNPEK